MPCYLVERTFSGGLEIPIDDRGARICFEIIDCNADQGVTWLKSYVNETDARRFVSTTRRPLRRSAKPRLATAYRSTGSPRCASSIPISTDEEEHEDDDTKTTKDRSRDCSRPGGRPAHVRDRARNGSGREECAGLCCRGRTRSFHRQGSQQEAGPETRQAARTGPRRNRQVRDRLDAAKADGYTITITQMIPDMGHHFLNPNITEFDVTKPPILVYVRDGDDWQLMAFEWVFTEKPARRPLPGATYGSFPAACHYEDGTFVFKKNEANCSDTSPESGARFTFWHPKLVTLHMWAWYPNPDGLFNGTDRWVRPYNDEQV